MIVQWNAWQLWSNIMSDTNSFNSISWCQFMSTKNVIIFSFRKERLYLPVDKWFLQKAFGKELHCAAPSCSTEVKMRWQRLVSLNKLLHCYLRTFIESSSSLQMCQPASSPLARHDFTQYLPISFDALKIFWQGNHKMSELSCIIFMESSGMVQWLLLLLMP